MECARPGRDAWIVEVATHRMGRVEWLQRPGVQASKPRPQGPRARTACPPSRGRSPTALPDGRPRRRAPGRDRAPQPRRGPRSRAARNGRRARAALVHADDDAVVAGLPAAALVGRPLLEREPEQLLPEPPRAGRIVGRKLDQEGRHGQTVPCRRCRKASRFERRPSDRPGTARHHREDYGNSLLLRGEHAEVTGRWRA